MAKNDNLKDFLTDVADAIRKKKGSSELINPQDFSAEISSIQSGGGGGAIAASAKAVNFRDCDGTILHSYTKDEFLALTELPPLPTREGLICQEWNWDFADAVEYVTEYGVLEVGATYVTDDGKTRLYITIATTGRMDVPLYFNQSVANGVTIDWGDGSATETLSGTKNVNTTHHYNAIGDYVISLDVADGCTLRLGHSHASYCVMGSTAYTGRKYCNMLRKAEIGQGVTLIDSYAFGYCYSLSSVVFPKSIKTISNYALEYCYPLLSVVIPKGVTTLNNEVFYNCRSILSVAIPKGITSISASLFSGCNSLSSVVIPKGVTSVGNYAFQECNSLSSVVIPKGVTSVGKYMFKNCHSLSSAVIPEGVTIISDDMFYNCYSLLSVVIPKGVTSVESNAFYYCSGMAFYDFSSLDSVPSLGSTAAFYSIPSDCKIIVPDALFDEWIAATNWSTYASKIIKKSDWDALNA